MMHDKVSDNHDEFHDVQVLTRAHSCVCIYCLRNTMKTYYSDTVDCTVIIYYRADENTYNRRKILATCHIKPNQIVENCI